jgi:hypothetical protein
LVKKKNDVKSAFLVLVSMILFVLGTTLLYGALTLHSISLMGYTLAFSTVPLYHMLTFDLGAIFFFSGLITLIYAFT